jgi:hypothetical protein
MRAHRSAVGLHVGYAEERSPDQIWKSGYDIVYLLAAGEQEPQSMRRQNSAGDQGGSMGAQQPCRT